MSPVHHAQLRRNLVAAFLGLTGVFTAVVLEKQAPAADIVAEARTMDSAPEHSSAPDLTDAVAARAQLLTRSLRVMFVSGTGTVVTEWSIHLSEHPAWVLFQALPDGNVEAAVHTERVRQYLLSYPLQGIQEPQSCSLLSSHVDEQGVIRAETDCVAKPGFRYDLQDAAEAIRTALMQDQEELRIVLQEVKPVITDQTGSGATYELLSTGHSNFKGSDAGRKANVRKALNERVNNVIVPAGATFAFNDTLGVVTISRGWHMALTIFEGTNLRPAPGGGICQASTTTYRAALRAGLPIIAQKNHSLYVTYYEKYGVGQDATIFPGSQDLKFLNDTGAPLLIQSYNIGDEAFVHIYGQDDGRSVSLSGPYFSATEPADFFENGKKLRINEIGWSRTIEKAEGGRTDEVFVARYKAIPRTLSQKYLPITEQVRGLATATAEQVAVKN